jgi:hypothetical protein
MISNSKYHNPINAHFENSTWGLGRKSKNLYRPLQPAVTDNSKGVAYKEFFPAAQLQPYIYCYWQLKTSQPLEHSFSYRVVADGCIDIAFNMKGTQESIVMGFHNSFNEFALAAEFNYVGIRFLPAMFPVAFSIDASELSNCMHPLEDVLPKTARFIQDNIDPQYTMDQVVALFDQYFTAQLVNVGYDLDSRFFNALNHILATQGVLSIGSDIDTGLSERQMRRLFSFYVGDSPKGFAKVVRFQSILLAKPSLQSLRQNKLFFDAGYYDQAHFIKEFRTFYGVTPSKAFGREG